MRPEKKFVAEEYLARLNASPFFLVVDYKGLSVSQFTELRKNLAKEGAELHVVKNTIFRICAKEAGLADLTGTLSGQLAVCTGKNDIAAAAKALKKAEKELDKPKIQFGYLGDQALTGDQVRAIADLPPLDGLRSQLVGLIQTPAQKLVVMLNTPATQLARVIQAKADQAGQAEQAA
jgi:large subunit ribosomal protein L10